jgi:hypothetical protein
MDRSFLSRDDVIAASRQFVCVRLATYEDREEGAFLKSFNVTRSGELENTVFCILSPDGKKKLIRAARGTRQVFAGAAQMAETMNRIAEDHKPKAAPAAVPLVANVRLALDVAASDNQPLVVLVAKDAASRQALEGRIAGLAWSKEFIGRFVYASTVNAKDLSAVEGIDPAAGLIVVQPDKFGQKGKVLKQLPADAPEARFVETLRSATVSFEKQEKTFQNHVREGQRQGVFWETQIPVTDPMEKNARERGRRQSPR